MIGNFIFGLLRYYDQNLVKLPVQSALKIITSLIIYISSEIHLGGNDLNYTYTFIVYIDIHYKSIVFCVSANENNSKIKDKYIEP